jgi:hypothetical protein
MTVVWVVLAALVGGFAGGMGATSAGSWLRRWLERRRSRARSKHPKSPNIEDKQPATSHDIDLIRGDLTTVKGVVDQVHELVSQLYRELEKPNTDQPEPPVIPRIAPAFTVDRVDSWRSPSPPRDDQIGYGEVKRPLDSPAAPLAAAPANAINVEARDDRLIPTSSYPPEAWLEPRGPASGQLWLNPGFTLNEYSLRRLSTFFHWESEQPGATYETQRPARIQWDEGRRIGTVIERGSARPC